MNTPTLETDRLLLRPFTYEDAEEVDSWEIGYNLGKKYWGNGYTTEAMRRIISFAKEELRIAEIVGRYAKENPASGKVLDKLEFQFEKEIPYECNNGTVLREGIQCRLGVETVMELACI